MDKNKQRKGLIILSGGLDSTVLAHHLIKDLNYNLRALSFNYGQKHVKELKSAEKQAKALDIKHDVANLDFMNTLFKSSLLQSGEELPHGHYEDENMKQTVVPNRNMILISIAAGVAISNDCEDIFYGAHAGDHAIYPDCRPEFIKKLQETLAICDWKNLNLKAPFQDLTKGEIVKKGIQLKVPFQDTWTCYEGLEKPCGQCGSCVERLEAFQENNSIDPIKYQKITKQ